MAIETTPFLEKLKVSEVSRANGRVFVETELGTIVNLATIVEEGGTIFVFKKNEKEQND